MKYSSGNLKRYVINILVFVFLVHGIIYMIFPERVHDYGSLLKYLKYVILLLLCLLSCLSIKPMELIVFTLVSAILIIFNHLSMYEVDYIILGTFICPLSMILLHRVLKNNVNLSFIAMIVYIITSICGYLEYFVLNNFVIYSSSGYRVVSIFLNPNNCAAMLVLITCYFIFSGYQYLIKIITALNSLALLIMTGSRMGLILYMIAIACFALKAIQSYILSGKIAKFLIYCRILKLIVAIVVSSSVLIACIYLISNNYVTLFSKTRDYSQISLVFGRDAQVSNFLRNVNSNFIFPYTHSVAYVDDLYLTIWGYFSFIILCVYVITIMSLLFLAKLKHMTLHFVLMFLFILYAIPHNFIYLTPPGYVFWYVAIDIYRTKIVKNSFLGDNYEQ